MVRYITYKKNRVFNVAFLLYISVKMTDIVSSWLHFAGWMWDSNPSNSSLSPRSPLPSKVLSLFLLAARSRDWRRVAPWLAGGARMICSGFIRSPSDEEWVYKTVWASHPFSSSSFTHNPNECVLKVSQTGWVYYWKFKLSAFSFFLLMLCNIMDALTSYVHFL